MHQVAAEETAEELLRMVASEPVVPFRRYSAAGLSVLNLGRTPVLAHSEKSVVAMAAAHQGLPDFAKVDFEEAAAEEEKLAKERSALPVVASAWAMVVVGVLAEAAAKPMEPTAEQQPWPDLAGWRPVPPNAVQHPDPLDRSPPAVFC